jgi:DNA-binding GntR family transcriptional regulator
MKCSTIGDLKPDQEIRELELARDFGVSQSTIREAMTEREHKELVIRIPHKATRVKNLTSTDLRERIAVHIVLETLACELAVQKLTSVEFDELDELATKIKVGEGGPDADLRFHEFIWERCGNSTLKATLDNLSSCLFGFASVMRRANLQNQGERIESHRILTEALRFGARAARAKGAQQQLQAKERIGDAVREHLVSAYQPFFDGGLRILRFSANLGAEAVSSRFRGDGWPFSRPYTVPLARKGLRAHG